MDEHDEPREAVDAAYAPTESLSEPTAPTLHLTDPPARSAGTAPTVRLPDPPTAAAGRPAESRANAGPPAAPAGDVDLELLSRQTRFRIEQLLGEGGMGKVYRAFDTELARPVALKVLFASDRDADARFAREAQAQARVDHPHVGKVYETGSIGGRRYIVMQLIQGETLDRAGAGMTLEQKVLALRRVSEGVHAAHRIGLVHRDIKPSNVLVARTEEGEHHPYVLDFGIARDLESGQTATSAIVGTPWYMAPEQVSAAAVDRRTDVYALGVTLYQLLTGKLPITGTGSVDVLVRVLREEPIPLLVADPHLPADLQTVVMKCLEKDPSRRYDSARALAEDLGRFLDGDPVAARPATLAYRTAKKLRKHRILVAVAAAAMAAVVTVGLVALRQSWRAKKVEDLSATYGEEAERFEWVLRAERQMPLHDTRPLEARLHARLTSVRSEIDRLPAAERGPGLYALGRGELALGNVTVAEELLDQAWNLGNRGPMVAYWRGKAKILTLKRDLDRARSLWTGERRAQAIEDVMRSDREAAVVSLQAGHGKGMEDEAFGRALLEWAAGRPRAAIDLALQQLERSPYFYDARILIGDAELELARAAATAEEREIALDRARTAYAAAAEIGASDPRPHQRLCELGLDRALSAAPADGRRLAAEALESCDRALVADATDELALETRSAVQDFLAAGEAPVSRAGSRGPG
jgi:hypothetical protein